MLRVGLTAFPRDPNEKLTGTCMASYDEISRLKQGNVTGARWGRSGAEVGQIRGGSGADPMDETTAG